MLNELIVNSTPLFTNYTPTSKVPEKKSLRPENIRKKEEKFFHYDRLFLPKGFHSFLSLFTITSRIISKKTLVYPLPWLVIIFDLSTHLLAKNFLLYFEYTLKRDYQTKTTDYFITLTHLILEYQTWIFTRELQGIGVTRTVNTFFKVWNTGPHTWLDVLQILQTVVKMFDNFLKVNRDYLK